MGKNTLHLNWGAATQAVPPAEPQLIDPVIEGVIAPPQVIADPINAAPQRKHVKPKQAPADAPEWWGVLSIGKSGKAVANGARPIFRHPTPDTALSEAEYLSACNPDVRFVVLHCFASFKGGAKQ